MHEALIVTRDNALTATGMSWREILRFAKEHEIPIIRVSKRRQAIDGLQLRRALGVVKPPTRRPPTNDTEALLFDLGILR